MGQEKLYYRRISDLKGDFNNKTLILQPHFQRNYVWDIEKQSRLIESVILDYPINPLHFSEDARHVSEVIDGQQRLITFFRFLDGAFRLRKLEKLDELNGCDFSDLPEEYQSAIKYYQIGIFPYSEKNDPEIKYEIFKRLNTGSMVLNHQELRNCVFHGNYNNLINKLAASTQTKNFLQIKTNRMKDSELVLAFFAIQSTPVCYNHKAHLKAMLDNELKFNRNLSEHELALKAQQWHNFIDVSTVLFTQKVFRKKTLGGTFYTFNESVYHAFCYVVPRYKKGAILENVMALQSKIEYLLFEDAQFQQSDYNAISSERTSIRIKMLNDVFMEVLGADAKITK